MRECLPRAIRNRPEPRYNKGGAIAVVKSTESLNSWYRSFPSLPLLLLLLLPALLFSFWPIPRCYPSYARTKLPREAAKRGRSLFLLALGELGDYVTCTRACMSLSAAAIWSTSVSLSLSEEGIYRAEFNFESNEIRWYLRYESWLNTRDKIAASIALSRFVRFNEAITAVFEGLRILSVSFTLENLKNICTVEIS